MYLEVEGVTPSPFFKDYKTMIKKTIERKVADTILEKGTTIQIGAKTYYIPPITMATIIMLSEEVANLPTLNINTDKALIEVLKSAKDCKKIGRILAILIIGAKRARSKNIFNFFGLIKYDKIERLSNKLLQVLTPAEFNTILVSILQTMEVADFFAVTAFLKEVNIAKAETTTAHER